MPHILVVDDEKSICELLEITFRKEGHRVEVAHNVEAAKTQARIADLRHHHFGYPHAWRRRRGSPQICKEIAPGSFFLLITGVPTIETRHRRDQLWSRPLRH